VTLIPQDVPAINQIVPIPGPLGITATPAPPDMLSPATGHLTTLYGTNEEYLAACECISSPETSVQQSKKRKISGATKNTNNSNMLNGGIVHIKQEPDGLSPEPNSSNNNIHTTTSMIAPGDEEYFDYGPDGQLYLDSVYQCIRFQVFQQNTCCVLCDSTLKELYDFCPTDFNLLVLLIIGFFSDLRRIIASMQTKDSISVTQTMLSFARKRITFK